MSAVPSSVPVLIVGGGPSGLAAAIELGRRGIQVVVAEPRPRPDPLRPRAKTTSVRTMEHLRRWGIADRLRERAPLPVDHAQDVVFVTGLPGREITRFATAFGLFTAREEVAAEAGQQAPQPLVEEVLREAVAGLASVTLLTGWRATSIEDGALAVQVELEDPDGHRHAVQASWVLGCDGSSGISRTAIGARYQGSSGELPNLSITFRSHALAEGPPATLGIHYWVIGAQHGGLLGRLDLDGTWWAIIQGVDATADDVDPAALVRSLAGADVDVDVLATDPWSARMLLADTYRGQRIFLVGDAAHLNPPWGGHGFNTCVGDAVNIGWKLAAVLQGWAPESLLDSYQPERRPVALATIAAAGQQEAFLAPAFTAGDLDDDGPDAEQLRAALAVALQVKRPEFHSLGLVLGYDYPDSPIVVPDGVGVPGDSAGPVVPGDSAGPDTSRRPEPDVVRYAPSAHPGARLPHTWLPDGSSLYDVLGDGFALLRFSPGADPDPLLEAARRAGVPLRLVDLTDLPVLQKRYAAGLVLVRPDQHVAWRGNQATDPDLIIDVAVGRVTSEGAGRPASTRTERT